MENANVGALSFFHLGWCPSLSLSAQRLKSLCIEHRGGLR